MDEEMTQSAEILNGPRNSLNNALCCDLHTRIMMKWQNDQLLLHKNIQWLRIYYRNIRIIKVMVEITLCLGGEQDLPLPHTISIKYSNCDLIVRSYFPKPKWTDDIRRELSI